MKIGDHADNLGFGIGAVVVVAEQRTNRVFRPHHVGHTLRDDYPVDRITGVGPVEIAPGRGLDFQRFEVVEIYQQHVGRDPLAIVAEPHRGPRTDPVFAFAEVNARSRYGQHRGIIGQFVAQPLQHLPTIHLIAHRNADDLLFVEAKRTMPQMIHLLKGNDGAAGQQTRQRKLSNDEGIA